MYETNNESNQWRFVEGLCDEYGCIYSKNGKRLLKAAKGLKSYSIKKGTEVICDHAFSGILLKEVVLPKSLKKIGDFAFYDCKRLETISLSQSLVYIGKYTFAYCKRLKNIDIPTSVEYIGESAFCDCNMLQRAVVPPSVDSKPKCNYSCKDK